MRSGYSGRGLRRFILARLHRRLFFGMGLAILLTFGAVVAALFLLRPDSATGAEFGNIKAFFAAQFAETWHDANGRDRLAERAARAFAVRLTLVDARGNELGRFGGGCLDPEYSLRIDEQQNATKLEERNGETTSGAPLGTTSGKGKGGDRRVLGTVQICSAHRAPRGTVIGAFAIASVVLWLVSGFLARRVGRPLWDLVQVTREIGSGKLSSRARLGRHHFGEVGVLATSINEMASRIEKQLSDQKELLAAVSHEIRTPLTRLRVLTELLRDSGAEERAVSAAEREIREIDDLTGQLLATSRLDFEALERRRLDPAELCNGALDRLGLPAELLTVADDLPELSGDATLLGRGLLNLLNNAVLHGGGPTRLVVSGHGEWVKFSVEDGGSGFANDDLTRVFDSFYQGQGPERTSGSLGLGLALVKRIARAHGGDAFAENLADGGARVGFTVRVRLGSSS